MSKKRKIILISSVLAVLLAAATIFAVASLIPSPIPLSILDIEQWEAPNNDNSTMTNLQNGAAAALDDDSSTYWDRRGGWILLDLNGWYDLSKVDITQLTGGNNNVLALYGAPDMENIQDLGNDDTSRTSPFCIYSDKAGANGIPVNTKRDLHINSGNAGSEEGLKSIRYLKFYRGNQVFDFKVFGEKVSEAGNARIPLTKDMVMDGSDANAQNLLDGSITAPYWNAAKDKYLLLDLGAYYKLSEFKIFHNRQEVTYDLYAGNDVNLLLKSGTVTAGSFGSYRAPVAVDGDMAVRYVKLLKTSDTWMETGELCLYGQFDRAISFVTLTIDPKNGEEASTFKLESGSSIGSKMPKDPTNGDKGFMGWFYQDEQGNEQRFSAATAVSVNTSVYAKWANAIPLSASLVTSNYNPEAANPVSNLFDGDANTVYNVTGENQVTIDLQAYYDISLIRVFRYREGNKLTLRVGDTLSNLSTVITYEGGAAADRGWVSYTGGAARVRYIQIDKEWGSISELQAYGDKQGEVPRYTVSFVTNTDTSVPAQSVLANGFVTLPKDLVKTNYRFEGWFSDSSFTEPFSEKTPVNSNLTLWAKWVDKWTPVTYTVTFESNGGTALKPLVGVESGSKITLPSPTRGGYVFAGWFKDANLNNSFPSDGVVTGNMTLYAKWVEVKATDPQIPISETNIATKYQAYQQNGSPVENKMPNMVDGNVSTTWNNWNETVCILDLGAMYRISFMSLNITGWESYTISVGKTADNMRDVVVRDSQANNNGWLFYDTSAVGRYVKITRHNAARMNELVLYGLPVPDSGYSLNAVYDLGAAMIDNEDPHVELSWTTPSINGFAGTADMYEIRYSKNPITDGNFADATLLTSDDFMPGDAGIPYPGQAGQRQTVNIYGLDGSTNYYFAVKTKVDWTKVVYSGISNVASITTAPDTIPPAQVTDFEAVLIGSRRVKFTMTAVGDNQNRGTAAYYDVRYSKEPITEENFWSAPQAGGVFPTQKSGARMTDLIGGLDAYTGYYFAVKAVDRAGNASPISNVVTFRTLELDLTPPSSVSNLAVSIKGSTATVTWTAPGNNGMEGMAYAYDFRLSNSPITEKNFGSASQVLQGLEPLSGGLSQTAEIRDLQPGKYYYLAMKTQDIDENVASISNVVKFAIGEKIKLDPKNNIIAEFPNGTFQNFIDEQDKVGDPANGPNGYTPTTRWQISWHNLLPTAEQVAIIDLGAEYDVTAVYYYDYQGSGTINFFMGQPFKDWGKPVYSDEQQDYLQWKSFSPNMRTRYIRLQSPSFNWPTEIVVYGIKTGREDYVSSARSVETYTTFDKSIGINCFIDDSFDMTAVAGNVRDYQNWRWNSGNPTLYPNNLYAFNPSLAGGGSWNFDQYYKNFADFGIRVMPDIKESFQYFFGYPKGFEKPIPEGQSATDPKNYISHADAMYQTVARYGSAQVPQENLKLAKSQQKVSGLNYITSIENWNEQDASWLGRAAFYLPFEYAAMTSADYDGHCGTLGKTVGAKNADPNVDFVMSGLANMGTDYVKAMNFWFKYNRKDGKFAADTLNFHVYGNSTGSTQFQTNETYGMCFEKTVVMDRIKDVMEYRDKYLPGKKVMISEFGWDTSVESPQGVREVGALTADIIQAQWLMRGYLIAYSMGVDETQMYMLRDVSTGSTGKYGSCGLITQKPTTSKETQTRKTSWYYIFAMKNALKDMKFVKRINMGDPDIWLLQFQNAQGQMGYAIWSGTQEDRRLPKIKVPLDGGNSYTMVEMKNDPETDKITTTGLYTSIQKTDGYYEMPWLMETPVFFLEGEHVIPPMPEWQDGDDVSSKKLNDDQVEISWPACKTDSEIMYYTVYLNDVKYSAVSGKETSMKLPFNEKAAFKVKIVAGDIYGQETQLPLVATKTVDFYKPAKPRNISLLMASNSAISLQWEEPSDNYDVRGSLSYRMYDKDKNLIAEGKSTSLVAKGLKADTEYTFTVTAVDAAGNESEPSKAVTARTAKWGMPLWLLILLIVMGVLLAAAITYYVVMFVRKKKGLRVPALVGSQDGAAADAPVLTDAPEWETIYSNSSDEDKGKG